MIIRKYAVSSFVSRLIFFQTARYHFQYTYAKDGSVRGVMVSRKAVLAHCRALTAACHYSEGDVMVCVVDCRREAGLWHAALSVSFAWSICNAPAFDCGNLQMSYFLSFPECFQWDACRVRTL